VSIIAALEFTITITITITIAINDFRL
jgi:hypothetical protein